jgi:hypothetical protein
MAKIGQTTSNVTNSRPGEDQQHIGPIWVAPLGTPVPTDARTPLSTTFKCLGYITEDGVTEPAANEAGDDTNAYGGNKVFTGDPTYSKTLTANFMEIMNQTLLEEMYGKSNVSASANADGDMKIVEKAAVPEHQVFVYDEMVRGGKRYRHIYPDATALVTGDLQHTTSDPMSVEITINAYPDADGNSAVNYLQTKTDAELSAPQSRSLSTDDEDSATSTESNTDDEKLNTY